MGWLLVRVARRRLALDDCFKLADSFLESYLQTVAFRTELQCDFIQLLKKTLLM